MKIIIKRILKETLILSMVFVLGLAGIPVLTGGQTSPAHAENLADLIIQSISWSPENPPIDDTVTFSITVKNQGTATAASSKVYIYIDDTYLASASVNPINTGATATSTFAWAAEAGSHVIKAVADFDNEVAESDETNNVNTFALSTIAPDLIIQDITWAPADPSKGDTVTFSVKIKNQGTDMATPSRVYFYIDGNSRGYQDVPRIDAGATVTKTFNWIAQVGSHAIKATADEINNIIESDETNNDTTATFSTLAPDLIIQNISWSPENPSKNDAVTFTALIKNQGSGRADYSYATYYIDDISQASIPVNPIEPGATDNLTFTWTAKAGSHDIRVVADSNTWVVEADETNNEKIITFAPLAPDLIIQDITWSPLSPSTGDTVTLTITIKNQGSGRADNSHVACYISGSFTGFQDVAEIAAGATVTKTFTWTAEEGSRVIKAVADVNEVIIENDETNNDNTVTFSTIAPDLIIQNITWSPENPSAGDTVTFTVSVKNQSSGKAGDSYVAYYIDGVNITSAYVNPIDAGTTANKTFTWTAEPGEHTIKAVTDSNLEVDESNETNNEKTITFLPAVPDLIIEAITWSPENPSVGDTINFTVTVKNQGSGKADYSRVAYFIDGSAKGYHDIQEIAADAMVTKTFTWTAEAGVHSIKVIVDSNRNVDESDETNNEKVASLPPPDLIVESIAWSPESPSVGDTVTFSITLENQGTGRADSSRFTWYIDDSSTGYRDVPEIAAGAKATGTFTWTAEAGEHTVRIIADEVNYITESDENNNEMAIGFSPIAPDLIIQDITWSLENQSKNNDVTFTITIQNQGSGRADSSSADYYIDDTYLTTVSIGPIEPGASESKLLTLNLEADSHEIKVVADSTDELSESDEINNEKVIVYSTLAPDLIIPTVTWSPPSPSAGEEVTFTVAIKNQGSVSADASRVSYYIDDSIKGYSDIPQIAAGVTLLETFTWVAEAGTHDIKIAADSSELVAEINETNNTAQRTLSLSAPGTATGDSEEKMIPVTSVNEGTQTGWWMWLVISGVIFTIAMAVAVVKSRQASL